ncbi:MAG: Ligand-binding SRPBCC domain protein family, partial [uncultured Pseudonocardia sp.]
ARHRRHPRPRHPHAHYRRRLRRARGARLAGLRRPAPAGEGVGPADLPGHRGRPRSAARRAGDLLHDQPRGGEVRRVLGRRRRRPADGVRVRGRVRRPGVPPQPGPARVEVRLPLHRARRRNARHLRQHVRHRRGAPAGARHGRGRGCDGSDRPDRRAARLL